MTRELLAQCVMLDRQRLMPVEPAPLKESQDLIVVIGIERRI